MLVVGALAVKALLPGGPGAAAQDRAGAAAPASLDRRKILSVFAASVLPASVCVSTARALAPPTSEAPPTPSPLPSTTSLAVEQSGEPSEEVVEEVLSTEAALAKLALTITQASQFVEKLEVAEKLEQLQNLEQVPSRTLTTNPTVVTLALTLSLSRARTHEP